MPMHIDLNVLHAPLNHILQRRNVTNRNAGIRRVPGSPPPLPLQNGWRRVPRPLPPALGSLVHVPGPATERLPLGTTLSRSCEGTQHRLPPSRLYPVSLAPDQSRPLAALLLLPPYFSSPHQHHAPFPHHMFLHFSFGTTSVHGLFLFCLCRRCGGLLWSALVCIVSTCQHLSELQGELKQTLVP